MRWLRVQRGWPQARLAEEMVRRGYPWIQTTVAKTEAAQRPIRVNELAALADVFDVGMSVLLTEVVEGTSKPAADLRNWIEAHTAAQRALDDVDECREEVAAAEFRLRQALDRSVVATATAEAARIAAAALLEEVVPE